MSSAQPQPAVTPGPAAQARALHLTNPLLTGEDVREAQQLLTSSPFGSFHPGAIDGEYGPATAEATKRAKWALGYPDAQVDEVFGPVLRAYLKGEEQLPPDFQARIAARKHVQQQGLTVREKIVEAAKWGIAHEPDVHYQQLRPMDGLHHAFQLPLHTDCSGFATLCYAWSGAPDPNGQSFNGQGYTGTMLQHMRHIPQSAVQPGDLVVWGPFPGAHVAIVLEHSADPMLCSHGQEKGPLAIRFSVETAYQPQPVSWLSCLP